MRPLENVAWIVHKRPIGSFLHGKRARPQPLEEVRVLGRVSQNRKGRKRSGRHARKGNARIGNARSGEETREIEAGGSVGGGINVGRDPGGVELNIKFSSNPENFPENFHGQGRTRSSVVNP